MASPGRRSSRRRARRRSSIPGTGRRRRVRQPRHLARGRRLMSAVAPEPITLEIIQSSLQATSDEMFAAFRKTAMSAIIYEVLDMGTAITDADGNLASSGAGIPAFVGVLDKAVMRIIELNGEPGEIAPGRHLRHERPLLRRRHAPERRRARHAGVRRRAADRLDGEHRALERRRRDGAGLDLDRRDRDLPGGPAHSRREAGRRRASRSSR